MYYYKGHRVDHLMQGLAGLLLLLYFLFKFIHNTFYVPYIIRKECRISADAWNKLDGTIHNEYFQECLKNFGIVSEDTK